ncbi:MAG: hypothetical protein ACJ75Z_03125 [Solirubrobacterales bacterium]
MTRMLTACVAVGLLVAATASTAPAKPLVGGAWSHGAGKADGAVPLASPPVSATGNGSTATATATCPTGTKAVGGGFNAPASGDAVALVYESVKVRQRTWRSSMQLLDRGDPDTGTLTTYVYCDQQVPATHTVAVTLPTTGQVHVGPTAKASCPPGQVTMAGGFRMPAPLIPPTVTSLFFDSLRSGTGAWDTRVVTGPAGPSSFTSEAYCGPRPKAPVEASGLSDPNAVDSSRSTAGADCPNDLSPAAGGFAQPDSSVISFFFVDQSMRVGDGWQVSAVHSGGEPAISLRAAVYCS